MNWNRYSKLIYELVNVYAKGNLYLLSSLFYHLIKGIVQVIIKKNDNYLKGSVTLVWK